MASISHKKDYSPFTSGLNSRFVLPSLGDTECSVFQNAQANNDGSTSKYPGYLVDGTPFSGASFIRTVFNYRRGSTSDLLLIAAADSGNANTTYKVDIKSTIGDGTYAYITFGIGTATFTNASTSVTGTLTSWTKELKPGDKIKVAAQADTAYTEIAVVNSDTSLTLVGSGYLGASSSGAVDYAARKIWNNGNVPRFCTFNNVAIIVDGNGIPQQYNGSHVFELINSYSGTTLTQAANPAPILTGVVAHKNRVFGWKDSTLYWSHVNDQTFWDPASLEPIFPQDGGDIISVISFSDSLVCLKNNGKLYRVFGNFDDSAIGTVAAIIKVDYNENIGIIADRSCCLHNNLLYFLAETGVYAMDARGNLERISYLIEPTTSTFNFSVGGASSKSFNFTTKTEWDTGTHNGTRALQSGVSGSFFDEYTQTDALVADNLCSVHIGTDNVLHVAYVPSTNAKKITYVRYDVNGTTTKEDVGVSLNTISSVSIAASPTDQTVGIAYATTERAVRYVERTPTVSGVWGANTHITVADGEGPANAHLAWTGGGVPHIAGIGFTAGSVFLFHVSRTGGLWSPLTQITSVGSSTVFQVTLVIDPATSDLYISAGGDGTLWNYKSTNGGTTWSAIESFTPSPAIDNNGTMAAAFTHTGKFVSVYTNTSHAIIRRNHTDSTSTTLDSTANSLSRGYLNIYQTIGAVNLDRNYYYNVVGTSPTQQEKFGFEASSTLSNPTLNVITKTTGKRPSSNPFNNNGQVVAMAGFGTSANQIVIRRVSFFGNYTGAENHDSTLSAWGTFQVDSSSSNGNTLTFAVALNSISPATSFTTIVPGAIISSSASLIYNIPRYSFSLLAWAGVEVQDIILNYTGAGIDARQAFGVSFYNEAYFAVSTSGQAANNEVLVYDFRGAPLLTTYAVNCMDRFKTKLYAGSSVDGKLLILKQGMSFNTSAYTMDVQTKEDFLNSIEYVKDFYKVYVLFNTQSTGSFVFSYRLDNFASTSGSTWTDVTIDQTTSGPGSSSLLSGTPGIADILIGQQARSIQFRIKNANSGESVQVLGFSLHYGILDRR